MKKTLFLLFAICFATVSYSQTADELNAAKAAKKDSISQIQSRVNAIQAQIDALPGWKFGAFGTVGFNMSNFNNWYSQ
ncbi:MAG: hypothetical protein V7767_14735, partial [Leeuwenhoekiella sp.]